MARGERASKQPDAIDIYIGQQIRRHRNAKDISQEQLAAHLGLTFQQVQKYERGMNRIAPSRLVKIAELFAVGLMDFFPPRSRGGKFDISDDPILMLSQTRDGHRIARAVIQLNNGARDLVVAIAEHLAGRT